MSDLRDRLDIALVENHESKWYMPYSRLDGILDENTLREIITTCGIQPYKWEEVLGEVARGGKKIFGILVMLRKEQEIVRFIENDYMQGQPLDAKLPFGKPELIAILGEENGELFYRKQWTMSVPRFRGDSSHRIFDKATIFPFTQERKIGAGAFGTIYEVKLDPEHHGSALSCLLPADYTVIRKALDAQPDEDEDGVRDSGSEGHVLSLLRLVKHPSIVTLVTSYVHRGVCNLVFEPAEHDLQAWLRSPTRTLALASDDSIYHALRGLCCAISTFHHMTSAEYGLELKGYHHDLKPQNILVQGSRFLLSDFGLSSLKEMTANSKTLSKDVNGFYIPPESVVIHDGFQQKSVGQPSDMWALGCILAAVVTYIVRGAAGVEEFEQKRKHKLHNWTTYTFHCGGEQNPAVDLWLTEMENECMPEASDLISLSRDLLHLDPTLRPSAKELSKMMDLIAVRSHFRVIKARFAELEQMTSNLTISIEFKRYSLFGKALQFDADALSWKDWPCNLGIQGGFDELHTKLKMIETYLMRDAIIMPTGNMPRQFRKGLCKVMDHLWTSLSSDQLYECDNEVEEFLVNANLESCSIDELPNISRYRQLFLFQTIKSLTKLSDDTQLRNPQLSYDIEKVQLLGISINSQTTLAELSTDVDQQKKSVLVEWLEYDEHWQVDEAKLLYTRMESICELLHQAKKPKLLRSLDCIGFFHAKYRHSFGLIFDIPDSFQKSNPGSTLTTLGELLMNSRVQSQPPALGDVFHLARLLVKSILGWQKAGWLHRRLTPFNILVLKDCQTPAFSIKNPYLIGFEYSRPNLQDTLTTGPPEDDTHLDYCHPAYLQDRTRYRPEFDYYSLGLILLEIAYWKPLESIISEFRGPNQSPEELRKWLMNAPSSGLKSRVGELYEKAVQTCLSFPMSGDSLADRDLDSQTLMLFEVMVMAEVESNATYEIQADSHDKRPTGDVPKGIPLDASQGLDNVCYNISLSTISDAK
ncbi:kinase-like domain-containing protein [Xylaria arbuscula]|nr:kinase-like domain-containing protein [Xylaria arbuscula]